ncbi:hypothetical protein DEV91_1673 [Phyllobacterium brassicacearum]|nr:hypothetical protein DEV91_1673 [Phyllobacterium brassicacearum]
MRYTYRGNSRIEARSFLFLSVFVVFILPYSILNLFSFKDLFCLLSQRSCYDFAYLKSIDYEQFANAYFGGLFIQIGAAIGCTIYLAYLYISCPNKVFVTDKAHIYVVYSIVFVVVLFAFGRFSLTITDFDSLNPTASWFQDNPLRHGRLVPQPASKTVFLFTGLTTIVLAGCVLGIIKMIAPMAFGIRIKFNDIQQELDLHGNHDSIQR